jgi:hypothetical protein
MVFFVHRFFTNRKEKHEKTDGNVRSGVFLHRRPAKSDGSVHIKKAGEAFTSPAYRFVYRTVRPVSPTSSVSVVPSAGDSRMM